MPRTLRRWRLLTKPPRHLGDDPGGPPERYPHRTMVAGRGARGPEEQDRAPLGPTRHPAPRPARSADEFGLHLRGDLPPGGQGRSLGAAPMRHAGHEPASSGSRISRGSRSPWGHADGPGRMAPRQGARRAGQPHAGAAARPSARIEPGREHRAFSARELVVEPRVRLLPRHRRPLLRRLEPPHRPALAHHVHRPPRLGQCMRISAGWYYNLFRSTRSADLLCAVPEDDPVPAFINGQGWAFAGKLAEPAAAPLGFEWRGAGAAVPLTGFYLFTAFGARQESMGGQAIRRAD